MFAVVQYRGTCARVGSSLPSCGFDEGTWQRCALLAVDRVHCGARMFPCGSVPRVSCAGQRRFMCGGGGRHSTEARVCWRRCSM